MKQPVAYLRRSRVIDERVGVSWEVQESKVRELAALNGDNDGRPLILSELGHVADQLDDAFQGRFGGRLPFGGTQSW